MTEAADADNNPAGDPPQPDQPPAPDAPLQPPNLPPPNQQPPDTGGFGHIEIRESPRPPDTELR